MPEGDKSRYTDKQKRKAEHIAEGYEERGMPGDEAERIAWATVNKQDGGGKKSGSGRKGSSKSSGAKKTSAKKTNAKRAGSKRSGTTQKDSSSKSGARKPSKA